MNAIAETIACVPENCQPPPAPDERETADDDHGA